MSVSPKHRRTIFGLCRELGLDDEARKQLQLQVTGKSSVTAMSPLDAGRLIQHLRERLPRRPAPKRAGRVPNNIDRQPMLAKIEAQLADMGLSWQYAEGIAWRITGGKGEQPFSKPGVQRMEWARPDDLRKVIAALHVEQDKRSWLAHVEKELHRLGRDHAWLEERIPEQWRGKWQRSVKRLEAIYSMLEPMGREDEPQ